LGWPVFFADFFGQAPGFAAAVEVLREVAEAIFLYGFTGQSTTGQVGKLIWGVHQQLVGVINQGDGFLLPFFSRGFCLVDDGTGGAGSRCRSGGLIGAFASTTAAFVPDGAFYPLTDEAKLPVSFRAGCAFYLAQESDGIGVESARIAVTEVIGDVDHEAGGVV